MPYQFSFVKKKIHLKECNYSEYEGYRFERLKKCLQNRFQNRIVIHQPKAAKADLIYCSQVNLQTAINKLALLKREARLETIENDSEPPEEESQNSNLFYTALSLRSAVREMVGLDITSKITSEDICAESMKKIVPEQLFIFLSVLMFGRYPESSHCDPVLNEEFWLLHMI